MKLLTNGEIQTLLTKYAYDVRYRKWGERVPLIQVANLMDVGIKVINSALEGRVQERYRFKFSNILHAIERGFVTFDRLEGPKYREIPENLPPPQPRMIWVAQWKASAPCRSCAGHRWAKAYLSLREVRVCASCIPPDQYKALHLDTELKRVYKPKQTISEYILAKRDNQGIPLSRLRRAVRE